MEFITFKFIQSDGSVIWYIMDGLGSINVTFDDLLNEEIHFGVEILYDSWEYAYTTNEKDADHICEMLNMKYETMVDISAMG